ncbi:hypothetical protein SAMN03159496_01085 [Rhizobium sp. NFR07]|uniref:nuclear transport factor 2 family protein n=1 Tax=Rhizobium sp. NFR07 TaxID=1566262 RepID=UPI0008E5906D|nr:nuclear transport factor 2 family protein [Rhizobium sp. NFR07]SFA94374.1 hypothetical protein SAMN03159496_01085 [Rhizobium sp. NFR07]
MTSKIPARTFWRHLRAVAIATALTMTTTVALANTETTTSRNEGIIRDAFEDWAERGGAFTQVLSPDIVWTVRGSGAFARTYKGVESFANDASRPIISRLASPLVPEVHDIWAIDDKVIVRFDASAPTTAGGTYRNEYLWILTMKDDVVVESEAFLDMVKYQELVDSAPPRAQ